MWQTESIGYHRLHQGKFNLFNQQLCNIGDYRVSIASNIATNSQLYSCSMIIGLKEDEMMLGIYDEHKRLEKRKINYIRNFVEYRCKDRNERDQ